MSMPSDAAAPATPALRRRRRRCPGFTLTELLIVLVIAAVLTAIAVPSYRSYTLEARRSQAQTALTDAASRQEQFFLNNKSYTNVVGAGGLNADTSTEGGYYAIAVDAPDPVTCPLARCYVLRATPQLSQTDDSCGQLTLDSEGAKQPAGCW